jgi:Tfp pilus assembly protein PilZ
VKWLSARYHSGSAFLEHYQPEFPHGGLVVPTRTRVDVGDDALVAVRFPELTCDLCLRGFVAWRRAADPRRGVKGGVAVEFIAGDSTRRDFLLRVARGEAASSGREKRRIPIEMPCEVQLLGVGEPSTAVTEDISTGGTFVRCVDPPALDSEVVLLIHLPTRAKIELAGTVRWQRPPPRPGFGIEFTMAGRMARRVLDELVRRLEAQL